jgi:dTDP-4-dehydrorhamnose reductase
MLGSRMRVLLEGRGHEVAAPPPEEADLADRDRMRRALDPVGFDVLVNCAAETDVDACEEPAGYERALLVNAKAVGWLGEACRARGALLVHYSSDYVFDGAKGSPYAEEDAPNPVNAYGRTKWLGERAAAETGCRLVVIRTSWLYGPGGRHFVGAVARRMAGRERLEVVDDQRGAPTFTADLAAFTGEILSLGAPEGTYHFSNEGEATWYRVALEVRRLLKLEGCRVEPVTSDRYPRPARRPADSRFDLTKSRRAVGHGFRTWEEALRDYLSGGLS